MKAKIKDLTLPALVSDGMILQQNSEIKIWGWAEVDQKVKAKFKGEKYLTKANTAGEWSIVLPAQQAGGPFEIEISTLNEKIVVKDILIGEVWLCSGQSNMDLPMQMVRDQYAEEIKEAGSEEIREFKIPVTYNFKRENDDIKNAKWKKVTQTTILKFSAAAYFFAKKLNEKYKVPVGILNASVTGSPIEAWLSREALKDYPEYLKKADKFADPELVKKVEADNIKHNQEWQKKIRLLDTGLQKKGDKYYSPAYDDSDWNQYVIPFKFNEIDFHHNGTVWFRKTVELNAEETAKDVRLWLGRIVDADKVYVNGKMIGATTYKYPPRKYKIPASILNEGKNLIAVRVVVNDGQGEFIKDKPYKLIFTEHQRDLRGKWKYKAAAEFKENKKEEIFIQWQPTGLFNAMIAPLLNYKIRGVCWYQGESNIGREEEYKDLFAKMIKLWRARFGQGDFTFIYAQLPNFEPPEDNEREIWAAFRNAQREALKLKNTAMTVNIDLGEWNDLHPLNKKDVAHRFYLAARNLAYGEDVVYSGPQFDKAELKKEKVIIYFKNIEKGLKIKGDQLKGFELAAADKKFIKAAAEIQADKIILTSKKLDAPQYLRYAWKDNPAEANLYNELDLPAGTFLEKIY